MCAKGSVLFGGIPCIAISSLAVRDLFHPKLKSIRERLLSDISSVDLARLLTFLSRDGIEGVQPIFFLSTQRENRSTLASLPLRNLVPLPGS